jgi:flavin-dependent dehydrogenase
VAGKIAGSVAARAAEEGDVTAFRLSDYVHRFDDVWGKRIRGSRKTIEMIERLGDKGLNTLAEVLKGEDVLALANGREYYRVIAHVAQRSPLKFAKLITHYVSGR